MPVYNGEAFLAEAIASLLAQTRGDFELIISDNASTDGTWAIIEDFAKRDKRIRPYRQPENLGATANFDFVLKEARNDAFMWAAADDVWHPEWIERLLPFVLARPCLAYGQLITIDSKSAAWPHPADRRSFSFTGGRLSRRLRFYLSPSLNGRANPIYGMFRRDMFDGKPWDIFATAPYGGDVLALYDILQDYEIVSGGNVYLYKRRHNNSFAGLEAAEVQGSSKRQFFKRTQLIDFLALSNRTERVCIIALFPLAVLATISARLNYLWIQAVVKPDKSVNVPKQTP